MVGFEEVTGFLVQAVSEPVKLGWVIFGVLLLLVVLFSIKHFLDIAVDMWKIPFAVILDAIDLLAYDKPYLDIVAALGAFVLFWVFAKRGHHLSKLLAILAAAEALVGFWILPQFAFITNLLPLSTILMFILVWSD
ncbi:hypothetical protein J4230_02985 [Candidatus Woesearchaeota archaeon]|nr:hypothetical protein [Candidatus Woesearchaeota archaeon]